MGKDKMASRLNQLREFNQYDPYQQRKVREAMQGHWRFEFLLPVTKVVAWFKKRKQKKVEYSWGYTGCDCVPEDGYRSVPYCVEHYNPLTRMEV